MASEVLQSLSKAMKALKLYPDTSPIKQKFISDLKDKFSTFLEEYGDLILNVRQSELLYLGDVVYSQPAREESIAFRLYGDGIKEIIFSEGLDEREILDFIDVVKVDYTGETADDDIVTRLWEKEFKNIRHTVVEEGGEGEAVAGQPQPPAEGTLSKPASGEALKMAYMAEAEKDVTKGGTLNQPAGVELEIEQIYGRPFSEIFTLTPEEIEKVQQEMDSEEGIDLISELLDILFHILQIEKELDSYTEIIKNIEKALKSMVLAGDYSRVIPIMTTLKTLSKAENNFSQAHAEEAQRAIDALGDEEFLNQLTHSLNVNKIDETDALASFLSMLDKKAIIPMAGMMGTLEQMKTRRLVCDALAILAKDRIEPLLEKLYDSNWFVVRNIVYIMGKIRDPRVVSCLKRIKNHSEPRVRKEIVHTLTEIKSDESTELLLAFLNDNNDTVRVAALRNLITLNYQKAIPVILNIISAESFDAKDVFEKKEFFDALGKLGSKEILPYLKGLLMKRPRLFGKSKIEELRVYATLALKRMNIPEAIEIMQEGASSPDKNVKKICEDALKDMEKR